MEGLSLGVIMDLASKLGFPGILIVMLWLSDRSHTKQIDEIRRMYEKNVALVEDYLGLAKGQAGVIKDLKDVIILNTQILTQVCRDVETNQFCPHVRLRKAATGREEG